MDLNEDNLNNNKKNSINKNKTSNCCGTKVKYNNTNINDNTNTQTTTTTTTGNTTTTTININKTKYIYHQQQQQQQQPQQQPTNNNNNYMINNNKSYQYDYTNEGNNNNNKRKCLTFKSFKRSLPCLFAWTLLLSASSFYYSVIIPQLLQILNDNKLYWLLYLIAQSIIMLYTIVNFAIATFRDPGKYPKSNIDDSIDDNLKSPLYKNVVVNNNITVKTKWCSSCNFYRPLRVSHCSVCDSCIDQFDHHCPWLSNCVGRRNYRFFLQFLFFLMLHMILIFICCLIVTLKTPILQLSAIGSILLIILVGLLIFPIGGLFIFHLMLIARGRTTNEQVTGKYKGLGLFDRGCLLNFSYALFSSLTPNLILSKSYNKRRKNRFNSTTFGAKYKPGLDDVVIT